MSEKKVKALSTQGGVSSDGKHDNAIDGDPRFPKNKDVSAKPGFLGASVVDDRASLSEDEKLVHEALLAEAEEQVVRRMKKGKKRVDAVKEVAQDMQLTSNESTELLGRVKKTPKLEFKEQPVPVTETTPSNSLLFESSEDAEAALGMLMYRSTPWTSKGAIGEQSFIQFHDSNALNEAQEVLKRRYDFVENETKRVGNIQFDNLSDYTKVLEFCQRHNMLLEFNEGGQLDEDYDEVQARKVIERKKAKKAGKLTEDSDGQDTRSFKAKNKKILKEREINPLVSGKFREAVARRRWK